VSVTSWDEVIEAIICERNEWIAMLAFLDESGNSSRAAMITMAAIVARKRDWKPLEKKWWPKAMGKLPNPYHHTDCLARKKGTQYEGMDNDESEALQMRLIDALSKIDYRGFSSSMMRADWKKYGSRIRANPRYRDPWFFIFEAAITRVMTGTQRLGHSDKMNFVFDRQDSFAERAHELYNQLLAGCGKSRSFLWINKT
jgi:hypothetical protein